MLLIGQTILPSTGTVILAQVSLPVWVWTLETFLRGDHNYHYNMYNTSIYCGLKQLFQIPMTNFIIIKYDNYRIVFQLMAIVLYFLIIFNL